MNMQGWFTLGLTIFFSSKEQVFFNFMAAVNICSDFGAEEKKICHCSHFSPICLPWSDGTGCHDLIKIMFFYDIVEENVSEL